jgi:enoyl-CoA hydratase
MGKVYKHLVYEKGKDAILRLTLNDPATLNALSWKDKDALLWELFDAVKRAGDDDDIKVIIIKGAGNAFSSGHNLKEVGVVYGFSTKKGEEQIKPSQRVRLGFDRKVWWDGWPQIFYGKKPTIAEVHGYCLGAGCYLAIFCDITVASEDSIFGFPEQRLGGALSFWQHLIFLVGYKNAAELIFTGNRIGAKEALRMGLVNRVVPKEELDEITEKLAKEITLIPKDALAIAKSFQHLAYDSMGFTQAFSQGYFGHSFMTNQKYDKGEFIFFKERRDKGAREAFHERDDRFRELEEKVVKSSPKGGKG